ncbi:MAG: major facilitator family transporter [Gammaproteobacteria bacterium]|jgi:EmrB/QacA subfamily drug resistance transporter|nr:major facilitator family transporter [Gammaproteobacteria bacterium]
MQYDPPVKLAFIAGTGMFLSTLDSGIINIAIPGLIHFFDAAITTVVWTVTLYTLILSATVLFFGRLADNYGRLRIYKLGLWLFALSSLLCGAAASISALIVFRGLQGLSAAMLQATSIALLTTRANPGNLTRAMGIMGILLGAGPMLGPVIGGFILSIFSWRWLFWINIPICFLGLYGCKLLTPLQESLHKQPIHYLNLALMGISLFFLLFALSSLNEANHYAFSAAMIAVILLIIYFYSEYHAEYPVIQLNLFKKLHFNAPLLGIIAFGGATAIAFILPPLYLEKLRDFPVWEIGLINLSAPLTLILAARIAARCVKKMGTQIPMLGGMSIMCIALLLLAQMNMTFSTLHLICLLLLYGFGAGLLQTPAYLNLTSQFSNEQQGFITAMIRMLQNLSIAFESAGAALLISLQAEKGDTGLLAGIQHAWYLAAAISLIAVTALTLDFWQRRKAALA